MAEIDRPSDDSNWIELDSVEKEETPRQEMWLGIQLHLADVSLAETTSVLENFGVDLCRTTVHNWVWTADLEPANGARPAQVATDGTVITVTDQRFWSFAAVELATNEFLHIWLFPTRMTGITEMFLSDLTENNEVSDAEFLVDGAAWP